MVDFFTGLNGLEKFYFICAGLGGIMFVVRVILQFIGGMDDLDVGDADVDGDMSLGDSDASFTLLSFQTLTAFFMMFGLVGLALSKQNGVGGLFSLIGGLIAGGITVWVIGKIFLGMRRLQADGTIHIANAIGEEGTVYLRIPPGGTGKVQVAVQGRLRVMNAVSDAEEQIDSGTRVRVVKVVSGNVLLVEKV